MVRTLQKDWKKRLGFNKYEFLFMLLNYINKSSFYKKNKFLLLTQFKQLTIFSKIRIINFCIISGRGRSVFSSFRVSRIVLKKFASSKVFDDLIKT